MFVMGSGDKVLEAMKRQSRLTRSCNSEQRGRGRWSLVGSLAPATLLDGQAQVGAGWNSIDSIEQSRFQAPGFLPDPQMQSKPHSAVIRYHLDGFNWERQARRTPTTFSILYHQISF